MSTYSLEHKEYLKKQRREKIFVYLTQAAIIIILFSIWEILSRFKIIKCNKGVLTHRLSYPIGFLPMAFLPGVCAFSIALPVAAVNLFLNILPTLALRYNTPKLKKMLRRMRRNAEKVI